MDQEEFGAARPGGIIPSFPHFPKSDTIKPKFQLVDDSLKTHCDAEAFAIRNIPFKEEKVIG